MTAELIPLLLHLQNPFRPEDMARIEIEENFKFYGIHPKCRDCRRSCQQYAAPDSVIVFCQKVGEGEAHV